MSSTPSIIIGIDVSKDKLDIAQSADNTVITIDNTLPAVLKYFRALSKKYTIQRIVFEATGGYEKSLALALLELNLPAARVPGMATHHFAKAHRQLAKTDAIDAKLLVSYAQWMTDELFQAGHVSKRDLVLREKLARLNQLKKMRTIEQVRLQATLIDPSITRSHKKLIALLDTQIKQLTEQLLDDITADATLQEYYQRLQTVPGIGPTIASILICALPELGQANRQSLAALCGLAPINRESGRSLPHRSIRPGRQHIKQALYMGAVVAARRNPVLKIQYERMIKAGKRPKVALIAVARKMLMIINAMIKQQLDWAQLQIVKELNIS